jgi:hypothetical protein
MSGKISERLGAMSWELWEMVKETGGGQLDGSGPLLELAAKVLDNVGRHMRVVERLSGTTERFCGVCRHPVPGHEENCPVSTGEPQIGINPQDLYYGTSAGQNQGAVDQGAQSMGAPLQVGHQERFFLISEGQINELYRSGTAGSRNFQRVIEKVQRQEVDLKRAARALEKGGTE